MTQLNKQTGLIGAIRGCASWRDIQARWQTFPATPDQVWAGDITYIPTSTGWLYLAVVIDLCSRKIIGWALADHLRAQLAVDALRQAIGSRSTTQKPIFHSDRGSQYGSAAFREVLRESGMRQSMSARANPYHNAWTESFMGTLKPASSSLLSASILFI